MRHILLASLLLFCCGSAKADTTTEFAELLDEHWNWQMTTAPVWASMLGDRRFNTAWSDISLAAFEEQHKARRDFLRRTYEIDRNKLSAEDQLNYELFRRQLQDEVDEYQFNSHLMPFSHRGGIQNPESLSNRLRLASVQDFEDWLARIEQIDDRIDAVIKLAETGRKQGYMPPRILLQRLPSQIAQQVVDDVEQSPLFEAFEDLPAEFSDADQERLRIRARKLLQDDVVPAYEKLGRYIDKTYLPAARDSVGLSDLPNGSAWYEQLTRSFTTTRKTPNEIHRLGLEEVKRIRDEMQQVY